MGNAQADIAAARIALLVPVLMLAILLAGLVNLSARGNDSKLAQRGSNPKTLQRLLEQSRSGQADAFSIPFNLAQNSNAPPGMLTELAKHEAATVRAFVASNPGTPEHVVESLPYDCAPFVRKNVVERLGPGNAAQPAPAPTGVCPKHWR